MNLRRFLSAAILMVWGLMFCYLYFSGKVSKILHPNFQLCAAVAGFVLVAMAILRLFLGKKVEAADSSHGSMDGSAAKQIAGAVVLTAPLLVAATFAPNGFDAKAVLNRGFVDNAASLPAYKPASAPAPTAAANPADATVGGAAPNPNVPKTADGNIQAQTVDLLYAAEEPSMREDFENKTVELIGQAMPATANNAAGNRFKLVRMFMVCCAADARPVAVAVQTDKPDANPEMSWVKVIGKATFPLEGGRRIPVVVADSVKPCDPPEEAFIY